MRRARREGGGGEIAMMAVITKAMGAFLVIMLMLLPSYVGGRRAADAAQEDLARAQQKIEEALKGAGNGPLSQEEADKLRRELKEAQNSLDAAQTKISDLEARVDQYENRISQLEADNTAKDAKIAELEDKQKFLVEEPIYVEFDFGKCADVTDKNLDVLVLLDSSHAAAVEHTYAIAGKRRNITIRGLRADDRINLLAVRRGEALSPSECMYTFRVSLYGAGVFDYPLVPGAFFQRLVTLKLAESGSLQFADPKPEVTQEEQVFAAQGDLWKDFLVPDKETPPTAVPMPQDVGAQIDKAVESKRLPDEMGRMLDLMVTWSRISPDAAKKRLAGLDKPRPKPPAPKPAPSGGGVDSTLVGALSLQGLDTETAMALAQSVGRGEMGRDDALRWGKLFIPARPAGSPAPPPPEVADMKDHLQAIGAPATIVSLFEDFLKAGRIDLREATRRVGAYDDVR